MSKPIPVDSPGDASASRIAGGQEVSLGCGTLILIALIVMFFSNRGDDNDLLEREVRELKTEVKALKSSVDSQTNLIKEIKQKLDSSEE